jgi:hypothetical protein
MDNTLENTSPLGSFIEKQKKKNAEGEQKVVLHDECGDTLWDEVLAQAMNKQAPKAHPKTKSRHHQRQRDVDQPRKGVMLAE